MKPLFTVHGGEYIVGSHIEQHYKRVNVWIPSRDTDLDLLVSYHHSRRAISLQVKYSKDFLVTHMGPMFQKSLRACGWWTINRKKLQNSATDLWVFVLLGFERRSVDFIVIPPKELLRRLKSIHGRESLLGDEGPGAEGPASSLRRFVPTAVSGFHKMAMKKETRLGPACAICLFLFTVALYAQSHKLKLAQLDVFRPTSGDGRISVKGVWRWDLSAENVSFDIVTEYLCFEDGGFSATGTKAYCVEVQATNYGPYGRTDVDFSFLPAQWHGDEVIADHSSAVSCVTAKIFFDLKANHVTMLRVKKANPTSSCKEPERSTLYLQDVDDYYDLKRERGR